VTAKRKAKGTIVYGRHPGGSSLVFIPLRKAKKSAALWRAVKGSATWGEFRRQIPREEYRELLRCMNDVPFADFFAELRTEKKITRAEARLEYAQLPFEERNPLDDDPFHGDEGIFTDSWPPDPEAEMSDWLPREIVAEMVGPTSMASGVLGELELGKEDFFLAVLKREGYQCVRDDRLVALAKGWTEEMFDSRQAP
jgi:hypothetical protein